MQPRAKKQKSRRSRKSSASIIPPTRKRVAAFYEVQSLESEVTQEQLAKIDSESTIGLIILNRPVKNLDYFSHLKQLRWLQLRNCSIQPTHLPQLVAYTLLESLLLNDNNLDTCAPILTLLKSLPKLTFLSLINNPICSSPSQLLPLKPPTLKLLLTTLTPDTQTLINLKATCAKLQYSSQASVEQTTGLARELFQIEDRKHINLKKYLSKLKTYIGKDPELIYNFFASVKRFADEDPELVKEYGNMPWNLIAEWPDKNFLTEYKIQYGLLAMMFQDPDPSEVIDSKKLEGLIGKLLDEYYMQELAARLKKALTNSSWEDVNNLVEFVFGAFGLYMQRNQDKYKKLIEYFTHGKDSIKEELTLLFLKDKDSLKPFETLLIEPGKKLQKLEEQKLKQLLTKIKTLKILKIIDTTKGYSVRQLPFCDINLDFFNQVLRTAQIKRVSFDLYLRDRVELFSNQIFKTYNIKDYDDFAQFLQVNEIKSEQYFEKSLNALKNIVKIYEWLLELEQLQNTISSVDPKQMYQSTRTFFKRILGRPVINIKVLQDFFPHFKFNLIERIIDSQMRHNSVDTLNAEFKGQYGFLVKHLISGVTNPMFQNFEKTINEMLSLNTEQLKFFDATLQLFQKQKEIFGKNSLYASLTSEGYCKYPILRYFIKNYPDQNFIDELFSLKEDKIQDFEKNTILKLLKTIIKVDAKDICLVNRSKSDFISLIRQINDKKIFQTYKLLFELIEFSRQLYLIDLQQQTVPSPHNNSINPIELQAIPTLSVYIQKLEQNKTLTSYLLTVLKQELYSAVFQREQSTLTLNIQRYRKLAQHPIISKFVSPQITDILTMICENSPKEFLEIRLPDKKKELSELPLEKGISEVQKIIVQGILKLNPSDEFYIKHLRQAFYDNIIKDCLKKGMVNLAEYYPKLVKVEQGFQGKPLTSNSIPLLQISEIAKTPEFKDSELKAKVVKYFKCQYKVEADAKQIIQEYKNFKSQLDQSKQQDERNLKLISEIIEKNQLNTFKCFLQNIDLFVEIRERAKIFPQINWQFFDSLSRHNHLCRWAQNLEYLEQQMAKYKRVFSKYLTKPSEKNEYGQVLKAAQKLEKLLYNLELDCIINEISQELGLFYPKKFNFKMATNKMHQFFLALRERYPQRVQWLEEYNFDFCSSIRAKLGHNGFIMIKEYFCQAFYRKPKIDLVLSQIDYKVEYYNALKTISTIYKQRTFNPALYFKQFIRAIDLLSSLNILNSEIQNDIANTKYPLIPWQFLNLKQRIKREPVWSALLEQLNRRDNIYLQLINYLQNHETQNKTMSHFSKMFELIHSELSANDLVKRVLGVIGGESDLVSRLLYYEQFFKENIEEVKVQEEITKLILKIKSQNMKLKNDQLISTLRIFALRGEYLNRVAKINNKLRNILSDYDEVCIDIDDYLNSLSINEEKQKELINSLCEILSTCLQFKFKLFSSIKNKCYSELPLLSLTTSFIKYKQVDLKLNLIQTVNKCSILQYESELLKGYLRDIIPPSKFYTSNYQQTEFYHIAFFTSIRDEEKYQIIAGNNPTIKKLLDSKKQLFRLYRNYLAHYNCFSGTLKQGGKDNIMTDSERLDLLVKFDGLIRQVAQLWAP